MLMLAHGSFEYMLTVIALITTAHIVSMCKGKKRSTRRCAAGRARPMPGQIIDESNYEVSTQPQDPMVTALLCDEEKKTKKVEATEVQSPAAKVQSPAPPVLETGKTELNVDVTELGGETTGFVKESVHKDVQKTEASALHMSATKSCIDQGKSSRSKIKQQQGKTTNSLLSVNVDDRLKSDMQLKATPKNDSLRTEDIDTRLKSKMQNEAQ